MIIGDEVGVLGLGEPGIGIREKERGLTSWNLPLAKAWVMQEPEGAAEVALQCLLVWWWEGELLNAMLVGKEGIVGGRTGSLLEGY
jgi:hypothetical protein